MANVVELRPNPALLDSNFDGYKLSLKPIPTSKKELPAPVNQQLPSTEDYSLLHAKLYGLHNHLVGDANSVYFFTVNADLVKATVDPHTHHLSDFFTVFHFDTPLPAHSYNWSLHFVDDARALALGAGGKLFLLHTGDRSLDLAWSQLFTGDLPGDFLLLDATAKAADDALHLLTYRVESDPNRAIPAHVSALHYFTVHVGGVATDGGRGPITCVRQLFSRGQLFYAAFDRDSDAIWCASQRGVHFVRDASETIEGERRKNYEWSQTVDGVRVCVRNERIRADSRVTIDFAGDNGRVVCDEEVLLQGRWGGAIEAGGSTWSCDAHQLRVELVKADKEAMWTELMVGDEGGEYVADEEQREEANRQLADFVSETKVTKKDCPNGLLYNSEQIEECDFSDEENTIFERISIATASVTHHSNFGSHSVLFAVRMRDHDAPALAIRYDVDACVWQPEMRDDEFRLAHVGTLLAFGYIQASKQQKKFMVCAPDLSCAAICEANSRIFLYRQNRALSGGELRNRNTSRVVTNIAEQQLITLNGENVLGVYFSDEHLFVLTDRGLCVLSV